MNNKEMFFSFNGRMSRGEYWAGTLKLIGIGLLLLIVFAAFGAPEEALTVLYVTFCLAALIPSYAMMVKRLHDRGKSAWFLLLSLIPFGGLYLLIDTYFLSGEEGPNKYGPEPA